ncbi:SAM-dependent methyltransferase [Chloroflexota bacterium]
MESSKTPQPIRSSFRDPSGHLFCKEGVLYRQINFSYQDHFDQLITSGLYESLVSDNLLIPHHEVDEWEKLPDICYKIIQPEPVGFISYPYEWFFSQIKDAALTSLKIQKRALEFNMVLKDSSAYNIQFHKNKPVLIDTLSFEIYQEGQPWVAYRQFCKHFLATLCLMVFKDIRLNQLLRIYIDGLPLDLASKLLPIQSRFNLGVLVHIVLHASSEKKFAGRQVGFSRKMSKTAMMGLIDNLESAVRRLHWSAAGTDWLNYYDETNYSFESMQTKEEIVNLIIDQISPESVWDLGANVGRFSRIASREGIPTIAFDNDPAAVESNYLDCVAANESSLLALLLDLTNPSPDLGWSNQERDSLIKRAPAGAVLALALIHHLAISNNVPFENIAEFFQRLGQWLVIEYVPKDDPQVQKLLISREDIFLEYDLHNFKGTFSRYFHIQQEFEIRGTLRTIFLMESRNYANSPG